MKLKTVLLILLCAICLSGGCAKAQPAVQSSAAPKSEPSSQEQAPAVSDTFYPMNFCFGITHTWLDGGKTLAVQDGGTIRYINLNNQVVSTANIPVSTLYDGSRFMLTDNRILIVGGYAVNDFPGPLLICKVDKEWLICDGSIWDGSGNLIRKFPHCKSYLGLDNIMVNELSDGRKVEYKAYPEPFWINPDLIGLDCENRLFIYRISTDKLTLVDDMSDWLGDSGKSNGTIGPNDFIPFQDGFYYLLHKKEDPHLAGTIRYVDETGSKVLFNGKKCAFNYDILENGIFWATEQIQDTDGKPVTRLLYATDNQNLQELCSLDGELYLERSDNNFIVLNGYVGDQAIFYAISTSDHSINSYMPKIENADDYEILGIRFLNGSLQYLYSSGWRPEQKFWLYDTNTAINQPLTAKLNLNYDEELPEPKTHYADIRKESDQSYSVRVRVIE